MSIIDFDEVTDDYEYLALQDTSTSSLTSIFKNWTDQSIQSIEFSRAIKIRNLWIGVIGILLNMIGLVLLIFTKNIKLSLKITLMNLSFNDLLFLSGLVVNSQLRSLTITTDHPSCWPLLMICYTSILISYLSTSQLAFQNFVAVYYPLRCHHIVTPAKIAVSSISIWIAGFMLGIGCVGVKFDGNLPCIAFIPISSWGIGLYASICIFCAAAVSGINIKIFHKIWKVNRLVQVAPQQDHILSTGFIQNIDTAAKNGTPDNLALKFKNSGGLKTDSETEDNGISELQRDCRNKLTERQCDIWMTQCARNIESLSPREGASDQVSKFEQKEEARRGHPKSDTGIFLAEKCQSSNTSLRHPQNVNRLSHNQGTDNSQVSYPKRIKILHFNNVKENPMVPSFNENTTFFTTRKVCLSRSIPESQETSPNTSNVGDVTSSSSLSSRTNNVTASGYVTGHQDREIRRHGQVKVRNTLLILTFWCCFVTLPFLVSIIILISSKSFVKAEFAQSDLGIALSSLVTLNASTNPILYVWRFVQWKKLYTNTRSYIRNIV